MLLFKISNSIGDKRCEQRVVERSFESASETGGAQSWALNTILDPGKINEPLERSRNFRCILYNFLLRMQKSTATISHRKNLKLLELFVMRVRGIYRMLQQKNLFPSTRFRCSHSSLTL